MSPHIHASYRQLPTESSAELLTVRVSIEHAVRARAFLAFLPLCLHAFSSNLVPRSAVALSGARI
jgi:hypothetical protein